MSAYAAYKIETAVCFCPNTTAPTCVTPRQRTSRFITAKRTSSLSLKSEWRLGRLRLVGSGHTLGSEERCMARSKAPEKAERAIAFWLLTLLGACATTPDPDASPMPRFDYVQSILDDGETRSLPMEVR